MCGIFGVSLKVNASRRVALQKVKILGLYNITRGRDASGIFVNGEIIKGIGNISEFDDFIEDEDRVLPTPEENGVMLGHTRQGSVGYKKTLDEAHPFLINENLVFTHNGTIRNTEKLCKKFNLIEKEYSVDSQMLGTALDENDVKTVLESYTGAAALAYTYLNEPNILYLYHGKSKEYKHCAEIEERPLWFMETKDGLYYSSLESSLLAIRDVQTEIPYMLKHNCVFKIKNGKFLTEETIIISREEANVYVYEAPNYAMGKQNRTQQTMIGGGTVIESRSNSSKVPTIVDDQLIKKESLPKRLVDATNRTGFIYCHQMRYWEAPHTMVHGPIYIKKGGAIGNFEDRTSRMYFFWEGIMLKDVEAYNHLKALKMSGGDNFVKSPNAYNFALMMSKYAFWPITNMGAEAFGISDFYRHKWYWNGNSCTNQNFTPDFTGGRNYRMASGFLIEIKASQREKTLYSTIDLARMEVKALTDGVLLVGTHGGSSEFTPFLLQQENEQESDDQKEENELLFFYDIPLTSIEQAMENMGKDEIDALKKFLYTIFLNEFSLLPIEKEIDSEANKMINDAIFKKCSLMHNIKNTDDKILLEKCYEDVIEECNKKQSLEVNMQKVAQTTISFNKFLKEKEMEREGSHYEIEETAPYANDDDNTFTTENEELMEAEEVDELVETAINDMENLQVTSMELMDFQDSDYAQDMANVVITGVNSMLANVQSVLGSHGKSDFIKRVKKIRETKNIKDGVL